MRIFPVLASLTALAVSATPVAAQAEDAPLVMAPSSEWVADYSEDSCALRRSFAAGGETAIFELRQFVPGDNADIAVISQTLPLAHGLARAHFEPDDNWNDIRRARPLSGAEMHGVIYADSLRLKAEKGQSPWSDQDRAARESEISDLTVEGVFTRNLVLHTGQMRAPMDALRTCMDAMLVRWGIDPVTQRTLSRGVVPHDQATWAQQVMRAYPSTSPGAATGGLVRLRMIVGPDGVPTACLPNKGYAEAVFEEAACQAMMKYSKFNPALAADGSPVPGYFATTVVYYSGR